MTVETRKDSVENDIRVGDTVSVLVRNSRALRRAVITHFTPKGVGIIELPNISECLGKVEFATDVMFARNTELVVKIDAKNVVDSLGQMTKKSLFAWAGMQAKDGVPLDATVHKAMTDLNSGLGYPTYFKKLMNDHGDLRFLQLVHSYWVPDPKIMEKALVIGWNWWTETGSKV